MKQKAAAIFWMLPFLKLAATAGRVFTFGTGEQNKYAAIIETAAARAKVMYALAEATSSSYFLIEVAPVLLLVKLTATCSGLRYASIQCIAGRPLRSCILTDVVVKLKEEQY